ncbi:Hsp20 family protein [Candidatus Fermentibacteria bacterium]|nr:Hsp20 family protein [Candidatus Fermentibacteria bacterium]
MADLPVRRKRHRYVTPFEMMRDELIKNLGLFGDLEFGNQFDWVPAVDITESDKSIQVKTELPGLSRDDVEIEVANGVLTIKGEKREEKTDKEKSYHHREMRYGSFSRSFSLPVEVKADDAQASFNDGVLEITLPKEEKALHRKIEIK